MKHAKIDNHILFSRNMKLFFLNFDFLCFFFCVILFLRAFTTTEHKKKILLSINKHVKYDFLFISHSLPFRFKNKISF